MSAVTSQPEWPADWREGNNRGDLRFAQRLVEETMSPYWQKRRMMFSRRLFREQWLRLETAIVIREGRDVGLIAWDSVEDIHYLRELHLVDGWRGRGVGDRVLREWIARQEALGASRMRLKVFAENPARRLYERVGFEVVQNSGEVSGLLGMERRISGRLIDRA
ncbi:GNAT family N-acetyltransferase [Kushneria aurantia]|uniref:GNAT family N-acetyltransferase n=1 Tax=Kushneria aurantia TaxID=504092 RepID=A0ABV6G6I7_9GAMM|nr:GNAT family N-acetyltransferase [Kushneria aurantia]